MMVLLFLFSFITLSMIHSVSFFSFCFIPTVFLLFLFSFSQFNFNSCLVYDFMFLDEFFLFLNLMSSFVFMMALSSALNVVMKSENSVFFFTFLLMLISVFFTFSSSSYFVLYMMYETSLLPIILIIVKWGSYPERSMSSLMLLGYTAVFSLPFVYFLFYFYSTSFSISMSVFSVYSFSTLLVLLCFFTFAVKLPIYGLHYWLPMAHVEAPTFGSVILAGVLLKLGGVGLIRLSVVVDFSCLRFILFSYFIIFLVYSSVVCFFQPDFKRLVAYSSVVHMMVLPFLILASSLLSKKTFLLVMVFHGFSSPLLFMLVGVLYNLTSTRQLSLIRSLIAVSPLISFLFILCFLFSLPAPPFLSFLSEVLFMVSIFFMSESLVLCFILFSFFSMVYNLNWLSSLLLSSGFYYNYSHFSLSFLEACTIVLTLFFSFCFIPTVYLF